MVYTALTYMYQIDCVGRRTLVRMCSDRCFKTSTRHGFMGPFRGSIEGISSTWRPHGALKEHQDALPCQPVPPLNQTMERFLASVRPLLDNEKYSHAVKLTEEFARDGGQGQKLQQLLEKRAVERENWLADWWIKHAYLGYRDPVIVYVNATYTSAPMDQYAGEKGQIRCAASSIASILEHKIGVDNQTIPTEKIGGVPQCMIQYYHILGATRVPGEGVDHDLTNHAHETNPPRHVTIISNNHLFHVEVYDDDMQPLNVEQIEAQLTNVVEQSRISATPVGMLTNDNRDRWYRNYSELRKDVQNVENMESIHRSLFAVSLDEEVPGYTRDRHFEIQGHAHMAGGGSHANSGNRWWDKVLQLYVNKIGSLGFSYEHSVGEGPATIIILEKVLDNLKAPPVMVAPASGTYAKPRRLDFNLSPPIVDAINVVAAYIDDLHKQVDIRQLRFDAYGRDAIKKMKVPPDGYLQVNIQLAYYTMYGHLVSTYESGSLRKFRLGRTDTIRSVSIPVYEWCQAMVDTDYPVSEKRRLLRDAVKHHRWYTDQVVQGQAIDRHLFGLKLTALENNLDMPEFLKDPVYEQSVHWTLSTTTVPMKDDGLRTFAPVVHDGYGIYYNPQKDFVTFGISAWNTCETTDIDTFSKYLESALLDTYNLFNDPRRS